MITAEDVLRASEVAEMLDVPQSTVEYWASRGEIPSHKIGRHRRYLRDEIEAWLREAS